MGKTKLIDGVPYERIDVYPCHINNSNEVTVMLCNLVGYKADKIDIEWTNREITIGGIDHANLTWFLETRVPERNRAFKMDVIETKFDDKEGKLIVNFSKQATTYGTNPIKTASVQQLLDRQNTSSIAGMRKTILRDNNVLYKRINRSPCLINNPNEISITLRDLHGYKADEIAIEWTNSEICVGGISHANLTCFRECMDPEPDTYFKLDVIETKFDDKKGKLVVKFSKQATYGTNPRKTALVQELLDRQNTPSSGGEKDSSQGKDGGGGTAQKGNVKDGGGGGTAQKGNREDGGGSGTAQKSNREDGDGTTAKGKITHKCDDIQATQHKSQKQDKLSSSRWVVEKLKMGLKIILVVIMKLKQIWTD